MPKVFPVGLEAEVLLRGLSSAASPAPNKPVDVRFFSKVNRDEDLRFTVTPDANGELRVRLKFASAGEHELDLHAEDGQTVAHSEVFFAARPELRRLWPLKGDLHMHTTGSDGKAGPLAMARRARQLGHDFIAITDHDNHAPSLEVVGQAGEAGLDLLIIPGEEITIREVGGHILSLGASGCVGELRHLPQTDEECERIAREELGGRPLVPPLTAPRYAHAVWTIRKVRQLGGIAMIAHPCWVGSTGKYYPPRCLVDQLLADGACDGIELLGGSPTAEGNRLAIAAYSERAARCRPGAVPSTGGGVPAGGRLPIIGGSDAHCEADLGSHWTIAFAEEPSVEAIVCAIVDCRTVACDGKTGRDVAIYGPFDLVEYAYFLHREFFPLHDLLCRMDAPSGQIRQLYRDFWCVPPGA